MTTNATNAEVLSAIPVIPLRGNVAFPHVNYRFDALSGSALHAFTDAVSSDQYMLLLTQKDITIEHTEQDDFYLFGTIARTRKVIQNPDMSRSVIFDCLARAQVVKLTACDSYLRASVIPIPESTTEDLAEIMRPLISTMRSTLKDLVPFIHDSARNAYLASLSIEDNSYLVDYVAANLLDDYVRKQSILEATDLVERTTLLIEALRIELDIATYDSQINETVSERIEGNQRDYYLREQLKVIQGELGVNGDDDDEIREYSERIASRNLPQYVADKLNKELSRLAKTPFGASESTVLRNYLDVCLDIPWNEYSNEKISVSEAREILNADHDGLDKIKERILEYIAVQQIAPEVRGQILCFVGPPGVGKTSIALAAARAMKRNVSRISLGGVHDEADIRGHRKTYVGAMPGRIVDALTDAKSMNPVIVLDEIDKLSSSRTGDPASALLEVLDPEQNQAFRDHYTELPMDLSGCVFIATANYYDGIPAPLLDRMEVIELSSYTEREKREIALHHLVPKQLKNNGLTKAQLRFTDTGINEIIRKYTREPGVRELERCIAAICRKITLQIAEYTCQSAVIGKANVERLLGVPKYSDDKREDALPAGVINGLAYTSAGGDVLKVEVLVMDGSGKIELTGSLGDVMCESAKIAVSYVRSIAAKVGIPADFYKTKDLHIHFPEGAVPKDGPSAGITMTCAIVSALTGISASADVAMTGEMTLGGRVLAIGGLKEKTMAAYRAGISTVLIPRSNEKNLSEIDPEAKEHLRFILCDYAEDAIGFLFPSLSARLKREKVRPSATSARKRPTTISCK